MSAKTSKGETREMEKQIRIRATPEAVWQALTEADELCNWFPLDARVKPGQGGSVWMSWRNEYQFESEIEIWQPGSHLRLTAQQPDGREMAVDYYLQREGNQILLRLVHSGFSVDADWDELYDGTHRGWDFQLLGLKRYLENHVGQSRDVIYVRRVFSSITRNDAWKKLMGPDGLQQEANKLPISQGSAYSLTTPFRQSLTGETVIYSPPKEFVGTIATLGEALMRVHFDDLFGRPDITVTINTYGLEKAQVEQVRADWQALIERLYEGK